VTSPPPDPANPFVGARVEIASELMPEPFVMELAATAGDLSVYDGASTDGGLTLRCIAVVSALELSWHEGCFLAGEPITLVTIDGIVPWQIDVGADPGDVQLIERPSTWTLVSNGCTEPIVSIVSAASIGPALPAGVVCAGQDAFLGYASVMLQPGPVDGGAELLVYGDEGWNGSGGGTAFPCDGLDLGDGIDHCAVFGIDDELGELGETSLPFPRASAIDVQSDFVAVRDDTATIEQMAAGEIEGVLSSEAITDRVMSALVVQTDPEASLESRLTPHGYRDLLVVRQGLLDDSTAATTWAIWIVPATEGVPARVLRATAWNTCARGVADPTMCV
jgi:hypothetical protein